MRQFDWSRDKNHKLKQERDISFEEIVYAIFSGHLVDVVPHPNQEKYAGQSIYVVEIGDYAYLVPFIVDGDVHFLKTIIPSRKATKRYLR